MRKKNRKGVIVMAVLLGLLTLFGLSGCKEDAVPEPEPIDGGTTTHTDANAPKVIESKDITEFSVDFYLSNRWRGDEERYFRFAVKEEGGVLTASEEESGQRDRGDARQGDGEKIAPEHGHEDSPRDAPSVHFGVFFLW